MNIAYKVNRPRIHLQKIGWGLIIIVFGRWIDPKHTNAKTVPITAPLLFRLPITFYGLIVSLVDASLKKSERANKFRTINSKARVVSVLGLIKKGWNSWCSSLWYARIVGDT